MFLSRIEIPVHRQRAKQLISSPYRIHGAVGQAVAAPGRTLWRIDEVPGHDDMLWLYIMSHVRPDLPLIAAQTDEMDLCSWETKNYSSFLANLREGQKWCFRLKGNPTWKHGSARHAHTSETDQLRWLTERAEKHGFICDDVILSHRRTETFTRKGTKLSVVTVRYEGILEVRDADTLRNTLTTGIGGARAFGCGLLTLAPLRI